MDDSFNGSFTSSFNGSFNDSMDISRSTPNLPGYKSNKPQPKSMKQSFSVVNGVRVEADPSAPKNLNPSRSLNSTAFSYAVVDGPEPLPCSNNTMPTLSNKSAVWLNNAGQVIRFFGYFKEAVNESAAETYRVRKVTIFYYMEDGTIQINEHAQENSGIPQGTFLKRCIIPRAGNTGGAYQLSDLVIGQTMEVYKRTYFIVDADSNARQVCEMYPEDDYPALPYPTDQYTTTRSMHMAKETGADLSVKRNVKKGPMKKFMEASLGNTVNNSGRDSFLKNDRKVLRFTGAWDNRGAMFGDFNFFTIHYYLSDNTVEVLEQHQANNGKDPYPLLLKRAPLPTNPQTEDPNGRSDVPEADQYIHWTDLNCGANINVYHRSIKLISTDAKTREFYESQGRPLDPNCDDQYVEDPPQIPRNPVPKHSGFGSQEDSLASCGQLVPKPPKTEFDKQGVNLPKQVLRFASKMDTDRYDDKDRQFVIMFYSATNEIQVREPPQRNSGVVGGMWLSKRKIMNDKAGRMFEASDFYAGASVKFNSTTFVVNDVDEHTLIHMDSNPGEFPLADINYVTSQLRSKMGQGSLSAEALFDKLDHNGDGFIGVGEFKRAMVRTFGDAGVDLSGDDFPDQIVITVFRAFDSDGTGRISLKEFADACA